jgi:putative ABC transport system permease protein
MARSTALVLSRTPSLASIEYASLRRRPAPESYTTSAAGLGSNLMLKYEDAAEETIQQRIEEVALRVNGRPLTGIQFAEPQIEAAFQQEQNESKLLLICGGLALLLASIGLYGLATFAIERQVKEIGVRKVMGADVATIVGLYLWRFSRPIVVANIIAWPVAIYFVLEWIERFPYQMERVWLAPLCIATLGAVLLIAMSTVSVITMRAASTKPVRSLRYE